MKTLKYSLLALSLSALISLPALADHHKGGEGHSHGEGHGHGYSVEMIQQKLPQLKDHILEAKMLAAHSLDLMQHAHALASQASKEKNLSKGLDAATAFELGHSLHQDNMHHMKKMHAHLTQHLGEHQAGKTVLPEALHKELLAATQDLGAFIGEHHKTCHVDQKPLHKTMRTELLSLAHEMIMSAKKSKNTAQMLQAGKLLKQMAGGHHH